MQGWWECAEPDQMFYRIFRADLEKTIRKHLPLKWLWLKSRFLNLQTKQKAFKAVGSHYDKGNDLYRKMLDPLMNYSCAYWRYASDLSQAQLHKLELICRKLQLRPGQKVLDIGCGWGGFARYAAQHYRVKATGITISREQFALATEKCRGLDVTIKLQDYRDLQEQFDRIVSVGMLEHVGHKNYRNFMGVILKALRREGLCLLHFIGGNKTRFHTDPWINKYIFPQGLIPSIAQIGKSMEEQLVLEDWHNFGPYYDKTLMAWLTNFKKAWPELRKTYNDTFKRMWEFYLCSTAAAFRAKKLHLWQLVFSHPEAERMYHSVRPQLLNPGADLPKHDPEKYKIRNKIIS